MIRSEGGDPGRAGDAGVRDHEGHLTHAGAPSAGGAPRFRLRPSVEVVDGPDGDVYLLRPGDRDVVVRAPSESDRGLLLDLAAGRSRPVPQALVDAGVVVPEPQGPPLDGADQERFSRQLPYLAEFGDELAAQRRLRAASVVVLGCGGLGTWALGALACAGVGRFVLLDDDRVELSNLNRQLLYRTSDVGRPKADLAAAWVAAFDPSVEVTALERRVRGPGDLGDALEGADVLVLAADWPPYELTRWVNAACLDAGVPYVTAGMQLPLLRVGPLYLHAGGPCFTCHERGLRASYPLYDRVAKHRRTGAPATTVGPAQGIVATVLAMELMHLLAGREPVATAGRALLIDVRSLACRWEDVARDPSCPACAAAGSVAPTANAPGPATRPRSR